MKRSLIPIIILLFCVLAIKQSFAQDTLLTRVVYTNSDRTQILAKTAVVNKVDILFQSASAAGGRFVNVKNLAVLASTQDGRSLLIAGKFVYFNPINSAPDSVWAIVRIDSPFTNTGFFDPTKLTFGGAKILKYFTIDEAQSVFHFPADKMLPLGVLTPNESEWYVTLSKVSSGDGNQWFFHGKFDGSGVVDSVLVSDVNNTASAISGYHMSNLAISDDGQTMLAFVFDQTQSDKPRAQLFRWKPSTPSGSVAFLADQIQGIPNFRLGGNIDTCFGFLFRVIPAQPNPTAEIALAPNIRGDLTLYSFRWDAGGSIALTPNSSRQIIRSKLPDSLHFWTGITGNPQTVDDDKEVINPQQGAPHGNGGDMMFSHDGNSVVFVTCRKDDYATAAESGIYTYDLTSGVVTLVENDPTKMERQPIFTKSVVHKFVPPPYSVGTASLDKSAIDFGTHVDDGSDNSTVIATLTSNNASEVIITQAAISGTDAANFSVTLNPPLPATVKGMQTYIFPVTFSPTAVKSYSAILTIHYIDSLRKGEKDSIVTIQLTGIGKASTTGGVSSKTSVAVDLSVIPNPFTSATQITVTAQTAGSSSLEVRDLLGKEIYTSKSLMLGVGEKFTYSLDANDLHLTPGEYFILVRSAGDEVTRKVIYVK